MQMPEPNPQNSDFVELEWCPAIDMFKSLSR